VGINFSVDANSGSTRIVGDVAFDTVLNRVRAITPVPGGIGPVTDVWLMGNVADAARAQLPEATTAEHTLWQT
jgi:methylenetetrahydrofolate dehydrogenase (NADP+) / methenyltetrahydrofolate cyclohydrolase